VSQIGGGEELSEINELGLSIHNIDALGRHTHVLYTKEGHELTKVDALGQIRRQTYDKRTGVRISLIDESGDVQIWEVGSYFGEVRAYKDLAGQWIAYERNHTGQIVSEKGNLEQVTKARSGGGYTPPPKDIIRTYDEAGNEHSIVDKGIGAETYKAYDAEGCVVTSFFQGNGLNQRTNTQYDGMQRIISAINIDLSVEDDDSDILIKIFYDSGSNRRLAVMYAKNDQKEWYGIRECWGDYDAANRVLLSDGVRLDYGIGIAPGRGKAVTWDKGRVSQEKVIDKGGHENRKGLSMMQRDY
jgi:hypothetical protein